MALADAADTRLRFQVALSLGEWDDDRILAPLAKIAQATAEDRWTRLAVAVPCRAEQEHSWQSCFRASQD